MKSVPFFCGEGDQVYGSNHFSLRVIYWEHTIPCPLVIKGFGCQVRGVVFFLMICRFRVEEQRSRLDNPPKETLFAETGFV